MNGLKIGAAEKRTDAGIRADAVGDGQVPSILLYGRAGSFHRNGCRRGGCFLLHCLGTAGFVGVCFPFGVGAAAVLGALAYAVFIVGFSLAVLLACASGGLFGLFRFGRRFRVRFRFWFGVRFRFGVRVRVRFRLGLRVFYIILGIVFVSVVVFVSIFAGSLGIVHLCAVGIGRVIRQRRPRKQRQGQNQGQQHGQKSGFPSHTIYLLQQNSARLFPSRTMPPSYTRGDGKTRGGTVETRGNPEKYWNTVRNPPAGCVYPRLSYRRSRP